MKKLCVSVALLLALLGSAQADDAPSAALSSVLSQFAAKHLVMLYRQETADAPNRLDPTIQATSAALQHEFLERHFKLTQPSPDALAAMDHGPDVIVSFAPDAGMSMIYSVYSNLRPMGAPDMGIAEIRITAQIFIGSSILSTEEGRGQLQTKTTAGTAAYGVRRAYELAAKDAASDLADRVEARLKDLTEADITQMVADDTTTETIFTLVTPLTTASTGPAPAPAPASPAAAPAAPAAPAVTPPAATPPAAPVPTAVAPAVPAPASPPADAQPPQIAKRWLLAIAVGDVSNTQNMHGDNLDGPATDLKNIQASLRQMGFDESTTIALLDKTATTAAVRQALEHFRQVVQPNDEFVFYISGHGLQMPWGTTGRTLPVLYDTNARDPQALDFPTIATLIGKIPARQIVMLVDTCHAGAASSALDSVVISSKGAQVSKANGSPELSVMLRGVKATSGDMAVLSASKADESSMDRGPLVGGLFTSEFIKAVEATRGAAPLQDVYVNYVLPNVTAICARIRDCKQTPVLGYDGGGNMIRIGAVQTTRGMKLAPAAQKRINKPSGKAAGQTT